MIKAIAWRLAAAGVALLCAAGGAGAREATEGEWIKAARDAVAFGQSQGLPIELKIEAGDGLPGHTPIGLWNENGSCTLVVSARDNPSAARVSDMVDPAVLELFLAGAAIHEVGHCYRRLNGFPANEKLLPVAARFAFIRDWFNRRVRTEEAFADMMEVAWLARYHPDRFLAVVTEIVKVRTRFREPRHDTLRWLHAALAEGPRDAEGDLFSSATQRLAAHR